MSQSRQFLEYAGGFDEHFDSRYLSGMESYGRKYEKKYPSFFEIFSVSNPALASTWTDHNHFLIWDPGIDQKCLRDVSVDYFKFCQLSDTTNLEMGLCKTSVVLVLRIG